MHNETCNKIDFHLKFPLVFKAVKGGDAVTGETVTISSVRISIRAQHKLKIGQVIEVSIRWPVLYEGIKPLSFVVCGKVVSVANDGFIIQYRQYEYRTVRVGSDLKEAVYGAIRGQSAGANH